MLTTHRQPFTPFSAPSLQNKPATLGRHPLSEAVHFLSFAVIWLERSLAFHDPTLSAVCASLNNKNINHRNWSPKKQGE
jgi:hypothetical protein